MSEGKLEKEIQGIKLEVIGSVFLFALILATLAFGHHFRKRDRQRIRAHLKEHKCEELNVVLLSHSPRTFPNLRVYEVIYVSAKNKLFRVKCVSTNHGQLEWLEPVFMYSVNSWQLAQLKQSGRPVPDQMPLEEKSDKEIIIDGLTSNFKHERIWAAEQLLELNIVDWEMRRLLDALATDDEEPEVRDAATKIMKKLQIIDEG